MDLALAVEEKSRGFKPLLAPIGKDEGVMTFKVIWVNSGRKEAEKIAERPFDRTEKKQHAPNFSSPHVVIFLRPFFWKIILLF